MKAIQREKTAKGRKVRRRKNKEKLFRSDKKVSKGKQSNPKTNGK